MRQEAIERALRNSQHWLGALLGEYKLRLSPRALGRIAGVLYLLNIILGVVIMIAVLVIMLVLTPQSQLP